MDRCDALIVGGGPAGSTCAWQLRQAGLDVVVIDVAAFPRDKVCAGWITPQVVTELRLDTDAYRQGRTFQPITGFRVGVIGGGRHVETAYGRPVSFGIRRCEFDHYLLTRSKARSYLGTPVSTIRRSGGSWIVNETIRTPMLIGAGGQFCPVARWINGPLNTQPLIVAQEAEFPIDSVEGESFPIEAEMPELYFCRDLKGYGWCFRKQDHLNVGLGRLDRHWLPRATAEFVAFLKTRGRLSSPTAWRWRGHAYSPYDSPHRHIVDAGVLLVGDAAGLAYPQSGEGIRPAIESGLLAATTIVEASGQYTRGRLEPYQERFQARFGTGPVSRALSRMLPAGVGTVLARRLLETPAFVRHVVLDRWFLRAHESALAVHVSR
jgi:geranylgeranyl reductase family protein